MPLLLFGIDSKPGNFFTRQLDAREKGPSIQREGEPAKSRCFSCIEEELLLQ